MREDLEILQASGFAINETLTDLANGQRQLQDAMNTRLDEVNGRIDSLDEKIDRLEKNQVLMVDLLRDVQSRLGPAPPRLPRP